MLPLPTIKFPYTADELAGLPTAKGLAAQMGCPRRLLWLADKTAVEDFRIHDYASVVVTDKSGRQHEITPARQLEQAQSLVEGPLWGEPAALIVINMNQLESGERFLYHLLGLVAHRRVETRNLRLDFSFMGAAEVEPFKGYLSKPNHVVAWGPLSGHATGHRHQQALEFLTGFTHHTRILLLAADDIPDMFDRLRLCSDQVPYCFNLGSKHDRRAATRKEKQGKPKSKKVVTIG